jgi:uncharacterized protein (TIGR02001 family)
MQAGQIGASLRGCLLFCALAQCAQAEIEWSGQATAATDFTFRGVSQTLSRPALQFEAYAQNESGWWAGAWVSNVAFSPRDTPDDGVSYEIDLSVGRSLELGDRLTADVSLIQYLFPQTRPGFDYDYLEGIATLTLDDRHAVTLGHSSNVFGSGSGGTFLGLQTRQPLFAGLSLTCRLGYYDLEAAYGASYAYAEMHLTGKAASAEWRAGFVSVSESAEDVFYASTVADRIILGIAFPF